MNMSTRSSGSHGSFGNDFVLFAGRTRSPYTIDFIGDGSADMTLNELQSPVVHCHGS